MRHARAPALESLAGLLDQIRQHEGLKEKSPGVFYRKSKAFLHFHEDPAGLFADLTVGDGFDRHPVNTPQQQAALLVALDEQLRA